MRRIMFILPSLGGGGAERVVLTLLRHLDRTRFQPCLVVVGGGEMAYMQELPSDIEIMDLGCTRVRHAVLRLFLLIRQRRPDLVFTTLGHLNALLALLIPLLPSRMAFVAREAVIAQEVIKRSRVPWFWRWAYRRLYPRFDRVVSQSGFMKESLLSEFGLAADRVVVINNPLDLARIRALAGGMRAPGRHRPLRLVAAGRLVWQKGFDLLIDAMAMLVDFDVTLSILGEGPMRECLQQRIVDLGLQERVRLVGFVANPYREFVSSDALVLSSRYEAFPNVLLESLACGLPVIAAPAMGGIHEMAATLPSIFLAKEVSSDALAEAIRQWMASTDETVLARSVERYSAPSIVHQYEAVFSSILGLE